VNAHFAASTALSVTACPTPHAATVRVAKAAATVQIFLVIVSIPFAFHIH
jgi:hypothetical protein